MRNVTRGVPLHKVAHGAVLSVDSAHLIFVVYEVVIWKVLFFPVSVGAIHLVAALDLGWGNRCRQNIEVASGREKLYSSNKPKSHNNHEH